jgi:DedD protein
MRFPFLRSKHEPDQAGPTARRKPLSAQQTVDDALPADAVRTRARRRLMGAVALLLVGIVGFPLLFDTKPRPMSGDVPMELVRRDGSVAPGAAGQKVNKPLPVTTVANDAPANAPVPPAASAVVPAVTPAVAAMAPSASAPSPVAAVVVPTSPPTVKPVAPAAAQAAAPPAAKPVAAAPPTPAAPAPAPAPGRFVVQVGAYSALGPMREARTKVEKLGLKTYTQVVETDAGPRTRLRVGPFDKREQADAAAAKLKLANLPANILTL